MHHSPHNHNDHAPYFSNKTIRLTNLTHKYTTHTINSLGLQAPLHRASAACQPSTLHLQQKTF